MKRFILLACAALALHVGCDSDLGPGQDGFAVWSDDESEILVVVHRYRRTGRLYDNTGDPEDVTSELWRFDPNTLVGERVQAPEPGYILHAFDMKSRGYTLLTGGDGDAPFTKRVDRDGERVRQFQPVGLTPSPSTDVLAWVENRCTSGTPERSPCTAHAVFVSSETLADVGVSGDVTYEAGVDPYHPTGGPDSRMEGLWSPSGEFIVRQHWNYRTGSFGPSYVLRPGEDPVEVPTPVCDEFYPNTSSTKVAADGQIAQIARLSTDGAPVVSIEPGTGPGYPARCFP